jgi:DMSO/TMAO reductase YedYZ heme-binding membrane subunit
MSSSRKGGEMHPQPRKRFWVEATLAGASGIAFVLTFVWKDWIEAIFGVDPDRHSGGVEWAIVAVLLVTTLAATLAARAERRRALRAAPTGT